MDLEPEAKMETKEAMDSRYGRLATSKHQCDCKTDKSPRSIEEEYPSNRHPSSIDGNDDDNDDDDRKTSPKTGTCLIPEWFNIDSPLMRVAILFSLFTKIPCHVAINNWFDYCNTLKKNELHKTKSYNGIQYLHAPINPYAPIFTKTR